MPKEQYMCQLCANHGIFNQPKKGHKQKCPHRNCTCSLCALNTKRRALDQIERQLKNASNEAKIDHVTSTNSEDFSIAPTTVKLPPTLSPHSYSSPECVILKEKNPFHPSECQENFSPPRFRSNSTSTFSVALPATITRREVRGLLKEELRGYPRNDSRTLTRNPSRTLKAALANIQRTRSIFHSAEQLAGTSS
ncbi:DM DNA binding domain protein [Necator americanus]|uniref:DM DNA binding domain protein n=1 Tax=Necator americanus TaxID=51031 RepID=W2T962_NECAM|nr:DM DNA binding domain protein [Necator americanus]ETN78149.1 DM DNA binding domain protein [Necator americanus]